MNRILPSAALMTLLSVGTGNVRGEEPDWKQLYEEQKRRTDALERRLAILEEKLAAEPFVTKEEVPEATLRFLQGTELNGYVAASYFYSFNDPSSRENTGRGFDVRHDEFMANKLVLRLMRPTEYNAFEWGVGYGAELILGQDAEFTQASGLHLGDQGDLLQAFVEVNVPLANGLKILAGKYSTPIGYELIETEENANWSGGFLWTLFAPFTHTGLGFSYRINNEWEAQLFVNNGWDVVLDNNHAKSVLGRVGFDPNEKTSFSLNGYGGPEQDDDTDHWRCGVNFVAERQWTPRFRTAFQADYGQESAAAVAAIGVDPVTGDPFPILKGTARWYGFGLWLIHEPSDKWGVAVRGEYLKDSHGARTSDVPALAPFPLNRGQELYSLTLTLNLRPIENLRVAPEVRWDRSTRDNAFGGNDDQVTLGCGGVWAF